MYVITDGKRVFAMGILKGCDINEEYINGNLEDVRFHGYCAGVCA
jgi:hypothetical protein